MSDFFPFHLTLLFLLLYMEAIHGAEYMGCYVDGSPRVLPYEIAYLDDVKSCGLHCKGNGYIYYATITASSEWAGDHAATNARLDFKEVPSVLAGAWAALVNDANQWLLFDLGQRSTVGVIRTRGRHAAVANHWVTSYSISYGNSSGDEMDYKDANGNTVVFTGNSDRDSLVTHVLGDYSGPFHARYVKFHPITWNLWISMRADIGEVAPVGFWPLNSHTELRDVSGYGNDATGVGVYPANGVHGEIDGAYSLSGSSASYIEIPNNGMLDTRYSITMLAYVYPTGTDGPIFNYRTDNFGVHLWQIGTNNLQGRMLTREHVYKDPISVSTLNLNEWNFVGMTYSCPSGKVKLWHDGSEIGSLDVGTFETETDYDIRVGVRDGDSRILTGRIACLQIYNIPLNGEQIREAAARCKDIDECATNNGGCSMNCNNTIGSFECFCAVGYVLDGDGVSCKDVDECASNNGGCEQNCANTVGSFQCSCESGFTLNSNNLTCDDTDECARNNGGCSMNCNNTIGSFECFCAVGYVLDGDGVSCKDVDECASNNGGCVQTCTNTVGSFQCSCDSGFTLNSNNLTCDDIDECATSNGGCSMNCNNSIGSFECFCAVGYVLDGDGVSCKDVDDCASNNGGCEQTCTNAVGSFQCSCNSGFTLNSNNLTCDDTDECATNNGGCSMNCNNTIGSFECFCAVGYILDGDGVSCKDVDECASNNGGCEQNCANTVGSFQCSCDSGFTLNSNNLTCDDTDECATNNGGCSMNCNNTIGSFECFCAVGYVLDGDGVSCKDVDECASNNGGCEQTCTNTVGSFQCSCNSGFTLNSNNLTCDDVDECASDNGGCEQNCTNTVGSFQCSCDSGFTLNSNNLTCDDIDECATNNGGCSMNCNNTIGSFECFCVVGYVLDGDGVSCKVSTVMPTTTSATTTPTQPNTTAEASTTTVVRSTAGADVPTTTSATTNPASITTTPTSNTTAAGSSTIGLSTTGTSVTTTSAPMPSTPNTTSAGSTTVVRSTAGADVPTTSISTTPATDTTTDSNKVQSTAGAAVPTRSRTATSVSNTKVATSSTATWSTATSAPTAPTSNASTQFNATELRSTAGASVATTYATTTSKPNTTSTTPATNGTTEASVTATSSTSRTCETTTSAPTTPTSNASTEANATKLRPTVAAATYPQTTPEANTTAAANTTVVSPTTDANVTTTSAPTTPASNATTHADTAVMTSTAAVAITNTPETFTLALVIPISWEPSYEDSTSPAFRELKNNIVTSITVTFNSVPGFIGVVVQRISRQDTSVGASVGVKFAGGAIPEEREVATVLITAVQSSTLAIRGVYVTEASIGNITTTGNLGLCDSFSCADHAVCIEIADEAECVCQSGYEGNGTIRCTDIDECMTGAHVCIRGELCVNRKGSYACASCYPDIALVGGGENSSTPVDIKRRVPFTVQSTVTVDCNVAYSFLFNWSLYSRDDGLPSSKITLPENVETTGSELTLPKNVLPYGKVIIRLEVTVEEFLSGLRVVMFAERWMNVLSSALVADIAGGSARSLAPGSDIVLDASFSTDPDAMVTNSADFTYNWTCVTEIGTSCDDLFRDGGIGQSYVIPFDDVNVETSVGWLTMHLSVRFPGRSAGTTSQILEFFPVGSPSIYIRCFSNCNRKINPSEKLVLVSECSNCEENEQVSYIWTLQEAPDEFGRSDLDWDSESTTGRNLPDLVIKPEVFTALGDYVFRVEMTLDDGRQGFAEYSFVPNEPPVVGSCTVSPENGTAMVTEFIITCTGFTDTDEPLTYTFFFNSGTDSTFSPLYIGTEPTTPPQLFPVGQEPHDYVVRIRVEVSDSFGATSLGETSVQVLALPAEQYTAVASQLVVGENSPLTKLVREGDAKSLVHMSNSVTSVLNSVRANSSAKAREAATQAREAVVTALTTIKPTSVSSVNLVASALGSATIRGDEVSADALVATARSLQNMGEFLKSLPPGELEITQVERTSSVMMAAAVNVLAGSSKASGQDMNSAEENATDSNDPERAKEATEGIISVIDALSELVVSRKRPNAKPTVISQGSFKIALQRQSCRDTGPQIVRPTGESDTWFRIPEFSMLFGQSCGESIAIENYETSLNPYFYANNSDKIKSPVASLKFRSDSGPVKVSNLQVPIDIMMPQKPGAVVVQTERGETTPTGQGIMSVHKINITEDASSVHVTVTPDIEGIPVRLFLGINSAPSRQVFKRATSLPSAVDSLYSIPLGDSYLRPDPFQWLLSASDLGLTGSEQLFLGVDHVPFINDTNANDDTVRWGDLSKALELGYGGGNFTLNYTIKIFTSTCLFFDNDQQLWNSDGCEVCM
ncbi:MATN2 [Branchiostoma lanceolatum]|uniref:MATN2 protein n=1 Tax=Branchiostoma lanceolatum TaxID=7740 RepID=A0A8J9ZRF1_BRALA|nr:MATN2 [Branchiostoma lanceolatum]